MKVRLFFCTLMCAFILSGCGRSEEAKAVDEQIASLSEITIDSKKDLDELDKAVEALSEDEQKSLKYKNRLEEYHSQYEKIVFDNEVEKLEQRIRNIGSVTMESKNKINEARNSYDKASDEIKDSITNYEILIRAEEEYLALLEKQKQAHAKIVDDEINKISDINLRNSGDILKARKDYNKLSADEKKYVTNLSKLEKDEKELAEILEDSLDKNKHERDDYRNLDFYMCSTYPRYTNERTFIQPYIVKDGNSVTMRAKYSYNGRDWIFWENLYIITDDNRYTITAASYDIDRDVCGARDLIETYDVQLTEKDIEMFRDIAYSTMSSAKFSGQYTYEYEILEKDKIAMMDLIAAYDYLSIN